MDRSGAEIITEHLIDEGVPYIVGLCGHGDLGLLDALFDHQDEITTISTHHESVAGFIADAYYRVKHQPLATFTSSGPGSANLPVALGSAFMDDSALLAITGNVATSQFNRGPFQETGRYFQGDFPSVVKPYVKRSFQATRPEQLPTMLRQAFGLMRNGRPGPVHLDVPLDVWVERTDAEATDVDLWRGNGATDSGASRADIEAILDLLQDAQRPVLVAGSGVEGDEASSQLLAFARLAGIPVATSPLGKSAIDNRDPALSRRHRAERHISGESGNAERGPGDRARNTVRRSIDKFLASRIHLLVSAGEARARPCGSGGDRSQLSRDSRRFRVTARGSEATRGALARAVDAPRHRPR